MSKSYHLSDIKNYRICPKLFYLKQRDFKTPYFSFVQMSHTLKTCLIHKLKVSDYGLGYRGMNVLESSVLLDQHSANFNLRFEVDGLRFKVPGLIKTEAGYELYFTSLSMYPRIEDKSYYASIFSLLTQYGLSITKIWVLYLNKSYQREDELDLDQCFLLSDHFLKNTGFDQGDILEHCQKKMLSFSEDIKQMQALDELERFEMTYEDCPLKDKCLAFEVCFSDPSHYSKVSAIEKLILKGQNPSETDSPLSRSDYAQILAHHNQGRFVDCNSLKNWMRKFEGQTLSFVDFEWDTYGIPPYHGLKPMEVLPFQYSMHILENGKLIHREFLGDGDCREAFIQSFIQQIPSDGPIFAYNAFGAEVIRLKDLASQFPKYEDQLNGIMSRFVDMAALFVGGVIYDEKMQGSFSLKSIITAIDPSLSYETLAIKHGMEAVMHYRTLQDEEEDEVKRQALLSYCHMDTLAMVKVYEWCVSLIKESEYA